MKHVDNIEIDLNAIEEGLSLLLDVSTPGTLVDAQNSAEANSEAPYQLIEGFRYDYFLTKEDYLLGNIGHNIIQSHSRTPHLGTISPNIFVGTLSIPLLKKGIEKPLTHIELEVQSVKADYRDDYRDMLELITEKSTDLLMRANSPVSQHFEVDYSADSQTLYQQFSFIKSIVGSIEFAEAVHRIATNPVTQWMETTEERPISNIGRFSNKNIKEMLRGSRRTKLPDNHYLNRYGLDSAPEKITTIRKTDSLDTPENRFIKHALEVFLKFSIDINSNAKKHQHKILERESTVLINELENHLHHAIFKGISRPDTLKLNSPVLQRKEGYREVLRVWLMFDLAAKLIWKGGDDVYSGGKKDVATLYEYWLFFVLLDLFSDIFKIKAEDIEKLIVPTTDGLSLQIKQGVFTALRGIYESEYRKLNIQFNYNRSFKGNNTYPDGGSWTATLRPDYTLSIWPYEISQQVAEEQELIVHIHFDAKYKVDSLVKLLEHKTDEELDEEKQEQRKGNYKNADLLKMHAYKDAIRRTGGAYVLYPGDELNTKQGFHEVIPGLGAFPVRPSKTNTGVAQLKAFVLEVVEHFINRTTQREKMAFRTFDIHKDVPEEALKVQMPELIAQNRSLLPDETYVLVGYYNEKQYDWIRKRQQYNFRMGTGAGSLILDNETVSAKFLLLHTKGDKQSGELWRITSRGPRVFAKEDLEKRGYSSPSQDYYLVIDIEPVVEAEFQDMEWDFRRLKNYSSHRASARPFTTNLTELMKCRINK